MANYKNNNPILFDLYSPEKESEQENNVVNEVKTKPAAKNRSKNFFII